MAKFIPKEFVEVLEYDFTDYGGSAGVITEPSTGQVTAFFKNMKAMVKNVKSMQRTLKDLGSIEEMDDDALIEQMGKVEEAEAEASVYQQQTIENIALLCGAKWETDDNDEETNPVLVGGSPSLADLQALPYRVLQAFSTWLVKEIQPKKTTPGTSR